jgi:Contractile injection system tube protein
MSTFPGSPKLLKGAVVGVSILDPLSSVVIFQYNPDALTRTIRVSAAGREGEKTEALRLKGPPDETIRLEVEIDAADQLEHGDRAATQLGVYPALSRLELLLYPSSTLVIANEVLSALGIIEVVAPEAPLTLLVWGPKRVLPVRMTGFTITEEAFDPSLNPIRAKVALDLMVLNYHDLGLVSVGGALFMAHQIVKEAMAKRDLPTSLAAAGATTLGIGG